VALPSLGSESYRAHFQMKSLHGIGVVGSELVEKPEKTGGFFVSGSDEYDTSWGGVVQVVKLIYTSFTPVGHTSACAIAGVVGAVTCPAA